MLAVYRNPAVLNSFLIFKPLNMCMSRKPELAVKQGWGTCGFPGFASLKLP